MLNIEEQDWQSRLSADLESALSKLKEKERRTIRARYYQGRTLAEIAAAEGTSRGTIFMREKSALRKLRRPACLKVLQQYL